jgi:hypothetical protein
MKKRLNLIIAALLVLLAGLLFMYTHITYYWLWGSIALVMAGMHVLWAEKKEKSEIMENRYLSGKEKAPESALTEVLLLGENNEKLTGWNIYGKNGLVIGRDIGENQVDVNLDHTIYASMIDIEHAVLNFSGNDWYVEDISTRNGVSLQKTDGKKYKLAYGKPCRLERGDIIYVALTKLQII